MRSRNDLRIAQLQLIEEVKDYPSGIMVLGMGGGKTAAFLTAALDLINNEVIDNVIVLAPPRVVDNVWPNEPIKWDHLYGEINVMACTGTPAQRRKIMQSGEWDVLVVSINSTKWLCEELEKDPIFGNGTETLLGIDEISKFKNPTSALAKPLRKIADKFCGVWGMTGSPRPNGLEDLFNPIKIVGGNDAWGIRDFDTWRRRNFYPEDYNGYKWQPHDFTKPQLERIASEWMVYASVADLVKPKLNIGDDFVRTVRETSEQEAHRQSFMKDMFTQLQDADDAWAIIQAMSQGVVSMKLTQLVQGFLYQEDGEAIPLKENPKLDELGEMDQELGGDRAIITYGFRAEIPQLEKLFSGQRIGLLGGGVSTKKANATIDAWNRGEIDRLMLHPASAGHGIELQHGGHHIIHYHPTWSAENYDQVIKRIDRPDQKHETFSWWIGMKDTVDDIKYARVQSKLTEEEDFRQLLRRIGV